VTTTTWRESWAAPILRLAGIRKSYGAVEALKGIDLEIRS
jgi:ABC-type sugar transport system ATPase subunit